MPGKSAIILLSTVLAACAMAPVGTGVAPVVPVQAEAPAGETRIVPQTRAEITLSFAPVVKQAAPAVVNIYTRKVVNTRVSPFRGDPFFERFFQDLFPGGSGRQRIENSLGSGVILDASGIVVSNHHVVAGADEITVVLQDRREFEGRVIFADKESDLAVVRLEGASGLPTLSLRDSDTLEVGDLVLAIGNPFGVGQTVTSGIISGLARTRQARRGTGVFIQTDAAINPGNSGGALVDMQGRLVGINTSIISRSGGSIGIGFAVPANLVARVVASARAGQTELVRPWLGFDGQPVTGEIANAIGMATPRGVLVAELHPASPLAAAGLRRGDVITDADGSAVNTVQELDFRAATRALGASVTIGYLRDGSPRSASVRLAAAPDRPSRDLTAMGRTDPLPGLTVINVNPAVIDEFDLPVSATGVLVAQARAAAARLGLRRGDFIRAINGRDVDTVDELVRLLRRTATVEMTIERGGRAGTIRYRR